MFRVMFHALLLALMFASTADASVRRIPVEDFFRHADFEDVSLSPDGKHFSVAVRQDDRTVLAMFRVSDRKLVGKWDYGANRHILDVIWPNNERILMRVAFKVGEFDFMVGKGDLYASNIDGTKRIDIPNGNFYNIASLLEDDPRAILVQRSIDSAFLFKLDIYNGRIVTVATAPIDAGGFLVDRKGNVRYAMGEMTDGRYVTLRREGDGWVTIHTAEPGKSTRWPIGIADDGRTVYMQVSDDGEPARVVAVDAETQQEKLLSSDGASDPVGYLWSSDQGRMLGVAYAPHRYVYDLFDGSHSESAAYAGLLEAFPEHAVAFSGASRDGRLVLLRTYSDVDPGAYYIFDREQKKATFLLASRNWIKPDEMAPMLPIRYQTRDGIDINGYLTVPKGSDGRNLPLVLYVHGGPHGPRDSWGFNRSAQFLANRGYAVLQVNYRGSGGYGEKFQALGYKKWGREMQDDLTDAVRWAVAEGVADPDRVCIYGASYGGYAALMSPVREPDLYRCTIGYVGVYSLPMMFQKGDIPERESGRKFLNRVMPDDRSEQLAQSPAYNVDKIKIPVMLVQGAKDVRVPKAHMDLLIAQMKKIGKEPEDVIVEAKEAHGFYDLDNNKNLYTRIEAFLDRHIGKGSSVAKSQN